MTTIYIYTLDTMADWEIGYVTAELNSGRFFKKDAPEVSVKTVGISKEPVKTMGGLTMPKQEILKKTTERKIGKVTYLVSAAPSERATEPIEKKLAKMIRKEVVQSAENAAV